MSFERGPDNNSRAAYDSVVFYYLDSPRPAFGLEPGQLGQIPRRMNLKRILDGPSVGYERIPDFYKCR